MGTCLLSVGRRLTLQRHSHTVSPLLPNLILGLRQHTAPLRAATTSIQPKTNQQEWAIRTKAQKARRKRQAGSGPTITQADRSQDASSWYRPSTTDVNATTRHLGANKKRLDLRDQAFQLVEEIKQLRQEIFDGGKTAQNALVQATELVANYPIVAVRYRNVVFNLLIELTLLAGKGHVALDLCLAMKKRGRHPDFITYSTIFNGLCRIYIDPVSSTDLLQRIDALYFEFDTLRKEALLTPAAAKPSGKHLSRKGQEQLLGSIGEDIASDEMPNHQRLGDYAGARRVLVDVLRDDPACGEAVFSAYIRLMTKLGKDDIAWNVLSRFSASLEVNPDGYCRLTRQIVGTWMFSLVTREVSATDAPQQLGSISKERVQQVIEVWSKWRQLIFEGSRTIHLAYSSSLNERDRDHVRQEWQRTLPKARQLQDLVQLAKISKSPDLSNLALDCLADFSSLPMPEGLGLREGEAKRNLPSEFLDPEHPLYMCDHFPLASAEHEEALVEQWLSDRAVATRGSPELNDLELSQMKNHIAARLRRVYDETNNPMYLGFLLGELMHMVPHATHPNASQVFKTILMNVAKEELATTQKFARSYEDDSLYVRINRQISVRTALHSQGYWSRALDSAAAWIGDSKQPARTVIQSVYDIVATMRELYRYRLASDPPDDLTYHRAMLHVSKQFISDQVGRKQLRQQIQLARWWLADKLEVASTTATGRHGWLPWAEMNGSTFAGSAYKYYTMLLAAQKRAAAFQQRVDRRRQKKASRRRDTGLEEAAEAAGQKESQEKTVGATEEEDISDAPSITNEPKDYVVSALRAWRETFVTRDLDRANPVNFIDEVPFPTTEMLDRPGPASLKSRGEKQIMPNKERWAQTAKTFLILLRIALDTGSQGADVLPAKDVQWMKAMRQRCKDILAVIEPAETGDVSPRPQRSKDRGQRLREASGRTSRGSPAPRADRREQDGERSASRRRTYDQRLQAPTRGDLRPASAVRDEPHLYS